jgi:hypothetical protein
MDIVIIIPIIRASIVKPLIDYNIIRKGTAGTRLNVILAWYKRSVVTSIS